MPAGKTSTAGRVASPCKFCAIVTGKEKTFPVYRDDICFAFLDYRPLMLGHVLLVPLAHYETLISTSSHGAKGTGCFHRE